MCLIHFIEITVTHKVHLYRLIGKYATNLIFPQSAQCTSAFPFNCLQQQEKRDYVFRWVKRYVISVSHLIFRSLQRSFH